MKFTTAIAALILAAAVSATAIPNPNPEPRCRGLVGQPCGKVKRASISGLEDGDKVQQAVEAFAEALSASNDAPEDHNLAARCNMGACYEAKMMTRDLATIVADTTSDPHAFFSSLNLEDEETTEKLKREAEARCRGYVGQPCGKIKRDLSSRDADPEASAHCRGYVGQPCGKLKRAAEAIAEAVAEAEPSARCRGMVGQPCGKAKRDALALARAAELVLENL